MPNYRVPRDYWFGTLTNAVDSSATTFVSGEFVNLANNYGVDFYLPITLGDPSLGPGQYEIVWLTVHPTSNTSATVIRGKEGSTARQWPAKTAWSVAPTQYDGLLAKARASLPADGHTGQRNALADEGLTVERTFDQGWQASVGLAVPGEYGNRLTGTAIPSWKVIPARGNRVTMNTAASGNLAVTYLAPFLTETLQVMLTFVSGGSAPAMCLGLRSGTETASGFSAYLYRSDTGANAASGISVTFNYLATGY